MPIIPRLVLHHEATELLCRERSDSEDEAEPLTSRNYIDMESDDTSYSSSDSDSVVSSDSDDSFVSSLNSSESSLALDIDIEAQVEVVPQISPLGVASRQNESLFYANDEVKAFGKTKNVVESTVTGAQTVAKNTIKGAGKVAKQTIKTTGKVAKQTGKTTRKVAKQTGKTTRKVAKQTGKVAKKTAKETEKAVKKTANAAIGLPLGLRANWLDLTCLTLGHILLPVAMSLVAAVTIRHSVDEGLSLNRWFIYGTHTFTDIFNVAPFVATCHYAMPDAEIPLAARMAAVLVGIVFAKLVLAIICEQWLSEDTIFPIPFSFIVSTVFALPSSLFTLWKLTPMRNDPVVGDKIRLKFKLCFGLLAIYVLSLVVACLWAVMFRKLFDRPWIQLLWTIFYQLLEFLLKIVVAANLTTRLNAHRWLQLNMVVDMIFAYVQIAMLPFFANWQTVFLSVLSMALATVWRKYAGVDRLLQFLTKVLEVAKSSDGGVGGRLKGIGGLAARVTMSPVKDIKPLSARLHGNGAGWDLGDDDEEDGEDEDDIEMQSIEKSTTDDENESRSTNESTKTPSSDGEQSAPVGDKQAEPKIDRRAQFRNMKSRPERNSVLREVSGEQRQMFHIVDSVSSSIVVTVVRAAFLITSAALRSRIARDHINASFHIPDEQWAPVVGYAIVFICSIIFVIAMVGVYIRYIAQLRGLTLSRVVAFVFRDSCWFLQFWFLYIQFTNLGLQLNQYGADFSLEFEWLGCSEEMDWPGCMQEEL